MAVLYRWLAMALLLAAALPLCGAALPENRAFDAAAKELADGFHQQAEADFAEFARKFPNSPLLPDAILFQAEARIKLSNFAGALELLRANKALAGKRADEYLFWEAEALERKGDLQPAADAFGRLAREFPASQRRLEAAVREATCRAGLSEWPRVLDLLAETNSVFYSAAQSNVTNEFVIRGQLLLGEAHLRNTNLVAAEQTLRPLANLPLNPQLNWRRQYLLCRTLLAAGTMEPALQAATNLLTLASATGQTVSQAESAALYAELLERLNRPADAIAAYERNLSPGFPPDRQRQALLKITELSLANKRIPEAAQTLEKFLQQSPSPPSADLALLTLGELRLRQFEAGNTNLALLSPEPRPGTGLSGTNAIYLQQALTAFETFTNRFAQSTLAGKALLNLGWCLWIQNKLPESQAALELAVNRLPPSLDQATAFFKLGDTLFRQNNHAAAVTNYTAVLNNFSAMAEVTNSLFEPTLYQLVRAGIAAGDLPAATNALSRLLVWFPQGFHTDRAVLLTAQEVGQRHPAAARDLLSEFASHAQASSLLPELQLAIARTHEQEEQWSEAIGLYDRWLSTFKEHPAQARAEYSRARANYKAGHETNAFNQFTNFLARFPTNEFAPLAQWWIADYHFRAGDTQAAEENYQAVYQNTNWPTSNLSYQARMMAGRAAFARQGWKDAKDYFGRLAGNTNCPPELRAQAYFAFGDTLVSQDSTNKLADYQEALTAFDQVLYLCPSNQLAALAWGAIANCRLQWARNTQEFSTVSNAFEQVLQAPAADAQARSIATVGLGVILEKLAQQAPPPQQTELLNLALQRYLTVFYPEKILRDNEKADPFWTHKAGLEAGRVAEALKMRTEAINVYQRLQDMFPALRLEPKINSLKAQKEESSS